MTGVDTLLLHWEMQGSVPMCARFCRFEEYLRKKGNFMKISTFKMTKKKFLPRLKFTDRSDFNIWWFKYSCEVFFK